jgi:hypothetical protein
MILSVYHWCPATLIVIDGLITSSRRYSSLNDGNAIAISTKAGVIVQISSISVPWLEYLCTIPTFELLKVTIVTPSIQNTSTVITIR